MISGQKSANRGQRKENRDRGEAKQMANSLRRDSPGRTRNVQCPTFNGGAGGGRTFKQRYILGQVG